MFLVLFDSAIRVVVFFTSSIIVVVVLVLRLSVGLVVLDMAAPSQPSPSVPS